MQRLITSRLKTAILDVFGPDPAPADFPEARDRIEAAWLEVMADFKGKISPYVAWKYFDAIVRPLFSGLAKQAKRKGIRAKGNALGEMSELCGWTDRPEIADVLSIWFGPRAIEQLKDAPIDIVRFIEQPDDFALYSDEQDWVDKHLIQSGNFPSRSRTSAELAGKLGIGNYRNMRTIFDLARKAGVYENQ